MSPNSRISSERLAQVRAARSSAFRRRVAATLTVLALITASLGAVAVLRGPTVRDSAIDVDAATQGPGVTLRIDFDRSLADVAADAIEIAPAADIDVAVDRSRVTISFRESLLAGRDYVVTIPQVRAANGIGAVTSARVEFATPGLGFTLVQRTAGTDTLVAGVTADAANIANIANNADTAESGDSAVTPVASADVVQDGFLLGPTAVVIATEPARGLTELRIVDPTSNTAQPLGLPSQVRVESMLLAGSILLLALTSAEPTPEFESRLYRLDLEAGTAATVVAGWDGEPVTVSTLAAIPGSSDVLVHDRDGSLSRYSPQGEDPPQYLGQFRALEGVSPDGSRAIVDDAFGPVWLEWNVPVAERDRIVPAPTAPAGLLFGEVRPAQGGWVVARALLPTPDYLDFDVSLARSNDDTTERLWSPEPGGAIVSITMSPNGQFAALEVVDDREAQTPDGSSVAQRPREVHTVIVDVLSGDVVADVPGGGIRWNR